MVHLKSSQVELRARFINNHPSFLRSFSVHLFIRFICSDLIRSIVQADSDMAQLISVKLSRFDGSPWGFRLQGGKDFGTPLVVQKVSPFQIYLVPYPVPASGSFVGLMTVVFKNFKCDIFLVLNFRVTEFVNY